jgi:methionyl aminopeptidase
MKPKSTSEIESMRIAGKMLATILQLMKTTAKAGMTPKELATLASSELKKMGGTPSFLGFEGFPDVMCISVNDQVQHAIPTAVPLADGDVVNFDFGVTYNKMITDAGLTVVVGNQPTKDQTRLLEGTERALYTAIDKVKPGVKIGDISATIEAVLKKYRLGIVRELVGHGVGYELHEDPEIPNYGRAGTGPVLRAGLTIAIEPITTLGKPDIYQEKDGWTLRSWDGSHSAQFEHTILVTETGAEILTQI